VNAFPLDGRQTIILAILVLFLGKFLISKSTFLRSYNIPEPVVGGLIASLVFGLLYAVFGLQFDFALGVRDELLIAFFTTIGLSSRFETLLKGGAQLGILLVLAAFYLAIQNGTGVAVATLAGFEKLVGVIGGSVSLSGGHGTAIAWTPIFRDEYGIALAGEIGIACATFGLILGGLLGGPLARFLVQRHGLESDSDAVQTIGTEHDGEMIPIDYQRMLRTILAIFVTVGIGIHIDLGLDHLGVQLPTFVSCLFAGILVTNLVPLMLPKINMPKPEHSRSLALISDLSLGLFLAISLMSLQLWTLADLGFAILLMLVAQVVIVLLWAGIVVFRAMGATYDAAVMSSGYVPGERDRDSTLRRLARLNRRRVALRRYLCERKSRSADIISDQCLTPGGKQNNMSHSRASGNLVIMTFHSCGDSRLRGMTLLLEDDIGARIRP
jgi:ESS family glutamate:Na+ symporter